MLINGRNQHGNYREAKRILTARVRDKERREQEAAYQGLRKEQLGSGSRGSKVRTWNFIESRIVDHRLGTRTRNVKEVLRGRLELLFQGERGE